MAAAAPPPAHLRNYRARKDSLEMYTDTELVKRYRLDRAGIEYVTNLVRRDIQDPIQKVHSLTPELKVILTLRYLATGKMQQCSSDEFGVSQSSVSRVITQTLAALSAPQLVRRFINFPLDRAEIHEKQAEFYQLAHFPGVVGVIDCTHVKILAPKENEADYVNRKNYHSLNIQLVFDAQYKIINLVSKWPGSVHDARILNESGLKRLFENNNVRGKCYLLGDSGYGCKNWLLTPFLRPQLEHERNFNRAHRTTCNLVERGIGQLKRRFHVLHGEVRLSPEKACQVVTCCAVLHNICKERNILEPEDDDDDDEEDGSDSDHDNDDYQLPDGHDMPEQGVAYRQIIARQYF